MMNASAAGADVSVLGKMAQSSSPGGTTNFTGQVTISSAFHAPSPGRVGGALVTFEPGARTAWHTHPLGQTLLVTDGEGWVQSQGHPRQQIRTGDVVTIPAHTRHWHGASIHRGMSHVAIAEALDGSAVTWFGKVDDESYLAE